MKKIIIACVMLVGLSLFAAPTSFAAWYTASVEQVGCLSGGQAYCVLSDTAGAPAFTNRAFIMANAAANNAALATLLTAQSLGLNVAVDADSAAQTISIILVVSP